MQNRVADGIPGPPFVLVSEHGNGESKIFEGRGSLRVVRCASLHEMFARLGRDDLHLPVGKKKKRSTVQTRMSSGLLATHAGNSERR